MTNDDMAVQAELEKLLARHADALSAADVETAVQLYTADAIVRPANLEPVRGHEALRRFFTVWFSAMTLSEGRYFTEELFLYEGRAFHLGTYQFTAAPTSGEPIRDRGSFMIVWDRQASGDWRYARGIFNSSMAPQGVVDRKGN